MSTECPYMSPADAVLLAKTLQKSRHAKKLLAKVAEARNKSMHFRGLGHKNWPHVVEGIKLYEDAVEQICTEVEYFLHALKYEAQPELVKESILASYVQLFEWFGKITKVVGTRYVVVVNKKNMGDPGLEEKMRDPKLPKKPLTPYFAFTADESLKVMVEYPDWKMMEVAKELGRRWCEVGDDRKAEYQKKWDAEKAKYNKAMAKFDKAMANKAMVKYDKAMAKYEYNKGMAKNRAQQN